METRFSLKYFVNGCSWTSPNKKKDFKDSEKEKKMDFNAFVDVNQQ